MIFRMTGRLPERRSPCAPTVTVPPPHKGEDQVNSYKGRTTDRDYKAHSLRTAVLPYTHTPESSAAVERLVRRLTGAQMADVAQLVRDARGTLALAIRRP